MESRGTWQSTVFHSMEGLKAGDSLIARDSGVSSFLSVSWEAVRTHEGQRKPFLSQVPSTLQGLSCAWQCYTPGKLAYKLIGHGPISG